MRIFEFQNVKADVLLVSNLLAEARELLRNGNPAIPGLLDGEIALQRDKAVASIVQAVRFNGDLLASLHGREKKYQEKADAIDV